MNNGLLASSLALSAPPIVFVTLVGSLILLSVRTRCGVKGLVLSRRMSHSLNASVIVMLVLFVVLVIVRFKTLA